MDPYYQQGVQQPQTQVGGQQAPMVGVPSAPPMQVQQQQPGAQMIGHQQQAQQQQQMIGQPQQPQQIAQGTHQLSHRGYQQQPAQQQQQQQQQPQHHIQQQAGYVAGMDMAGAGYVGGAPTHQSRNGTSGMGGHHLGGSGSHHHGGQAPLPPHHSSGGHSSGRYSHRDRSAMMHQHRSSAAAISDPMMASTITDHLASEGGPMTGSGSALNQLGLSAGYQQQQMGGYYLDRQRAGDPMYQTDSGFGGSAGYGSYQSRYDASIGGHHGSRSRGHSSGPSYGVGSHSATLGGSATTTAGAYHLDRNDLLMNETLAGGPVPIRSDRYYQSLGNLPAASSSRYSGAIHQQPDHYHERGYGATAAVDTMGLGSYNPLDDPLAQQHQHPIHSHNQHQRLPSEVQFGSSANYQLSAAQVGAGSRDMLITELRARLQEAQSSYASVKRELETATQKLGSSMHSIKSFWSPELKKERALRKEEATKYALINDQMKLMRVEVQKQALLIRQLEEELKLAHETRVRTQDPDIQQHIDALCIEKESLFKENCLLRDTIRELEMRLETQKQTLAARDDSIKKMVEMMNNKGIASKIMEDERLEMERTKTRNIDLEARCRHYETIIESKEKDLIKNQTQVASTWSSSSPQHQATGETSGSSMAIPKSPVPKQRKSILNAEQKSADSTAHRLSRTERLKSRLFSRQSKLMENEKQQLNDNQLSISQLSNSSRASSSSGVSSSRSSEIAKQSESTESDSELIERKRRLQEDSKRVVNCVDGIYKLCQCSDCKSSGQAIYSRSKSLDQMKKLPARSPTPPRALTNLRKAVSFRSGVEHIGSPRLRPLNDQETGAGLFASAPQELDSCDSLHVTKDYSLIKEEDEGRDEARLSGGARATADYLRPIDCSTPKDNNSRGSCNADIGGGTSIQAEVHQLASTMARPSYTCLCSSDFMCSHNLANGTAPAAAITGQLSAQQPKMPLGMPLRIVPTQMQPPSQWRQQTVVANDLYGTMASGDFPLARDCIECKNLSTYVNLSRVSHNQAANSSVNGYDSADYQRLLRSKQNDVYGTLVRKTTSNKGSQQVYSNNHSQQLDEPLHYLAAGRQLRPYNLADCEICDDHLSRNISSLPCSCPPVNGNVSGLASSANDLNTDIVSLTSKSYHTASSGSLQVGTLDASSAQAMINASQLSVLPVKNDPMPAPAVSNGNTSSTSNGNASSNNNNNNSNIDSSLSSLFVYRHISDNDEFDPDSLEIKPAEDEAANVGVKTKPAPSKTTGWLKSRPRGDYILLSNTTSSVSAPKSSGPAAAAASKQSQSTGKTVSKSTKSSTCSFVQADVTQSSLAKRRQLSNSLQQSSSSGASNHQQQQQPSKRKLLLTKASSRSSPNISGSSRGNANQSKLTTHSRTNSGNQEATAANSGSNSNKTNVKSIYQSVKNHLFDIRHKSSNSASSNPTKFNAPVGSSLSLPRSQTLSSLTLKSRSTSKSAQMEELRTELVRRDQELLTMGAKMKVLEDQQRDSQRHIRVLKDALDAKEKHYNLLQADVEELRRNLDQRNELIEKRSYQQTFGMIPSKANAYGSGGVAANAYNEVQELAQMVELREKKINELQRKVVQLDGLLNERDSQLDRLRMRLEHGQLHGGSSGADAGYLSNLQETLGDKERQISLLRDQRDRAEHELGEERDSHERSIKEYKMKLNSVKFEMDKLQNRLGKDTNSTKYGADYAGSSTDRFATDPSIVKRLEMDKRSLQIECDRLRDKLESQSATGRRGLGVERASSALGDYSVVEFERLQETLESHKQELRRAQAECRMNEMERKRAQEEADKLSERYERSQAEMHKLKAKLENATSEREQLLEDYERQQQMISKTQTERDCALADINSIKLDNDRLQQNFNRIQLECEKLQAQLERAQHESRKFEDRFNEQADELRKLQAEKSNAQRELKRISVSLESAEMQQQRLQQEKEASRGDLEKIRERYDRLEAEMERYLHDKELNSQQLNMYKERAEQQQQQLNKMAREKEQVALEVHELRERLHKQQKLQDTSEHETRNEVRIWKEKYERLLAQFEKLNEDMANKQKENQMVIEKFQRIQSEAVKLESKLEQSEMDRERAAIELERSQQISSKVKDDYKKWQDELQQLQEMYTKTNNKLLKLTEIEERLRIDYDKCQMDLEVVRERYDKLQSESRKLQSEKDRLQVEYERVKFDQERGQQSQAQPGNQDDFARVSNELERSIAKLEQYQREINKLQLEKERLLIDSKTSLQQTEQQFQQQVLKMKSSEEKLTMELERTRMQLDKVQSKHEQTNVDQEKLMADKERLQQQLLLLQQEVDKFRNQQSTSVQETKRLHDDEMQRVLQELETIREKYTQQRKELLQLRELQQNHELDKDILKRELESAEGRLEKLNQSDAKQRQDSERCMIEIEKMKDKIERKQQELVRTQKERNQFAQEITVLHKQIQQLQVEYEQLQAQKQQQQSPQQQPQQQAQPQQQQQQPQQQQQQQIKADEINKLKQMLVKSETDLQKSTAENQRFQMEIERLKLQLDDAAEYIAKIEDDNKMMQKQNQEIIQQLNQMQKSQQQQQQQQKPQQPQQQQSQQDVERLQQEMKKMQDVIKKSANEIQKLIEDRNSLQEANKEMQRNVEQTKIDFTSTIEQYEAELQRLQKENQAQKNRNQQQQQQQQPQTQNDEYKVKFEKAVEAIRAFQKTSDDMKKEIIKLNERNKSLSEQNQALAQSLKANEESLQKVAAAQQRPDQQQQAAGGGKEVEEMRRQVIQLSEVCNKLEKDLHVSSEESKKQLQSNQQLKQALDKSQSELGNLKTERDRFQGQLEKLMVELEHRENEMGKLQQQQDKSGQNLQAKQSELIEYQKKLEEREKALEAKRNELQGMQEQIQQQQKGGQNAGPNTQQFQETIAKLQQQIRGLEDERNKLKGELERVRNELKQSQAELERLLKILSASEEDKFNLTQQIEQLQNKLKAMPQAGPGNQPQAQHPQQQQQQQQRAPPPQPGAQQQQPGQQQPRPPGPQQQQQRPQGPPQQQPRPANPNQKPSGAGGFISGFFQ